jgi:hypothetical protein
LVGAGEQARRVHKTQKGHPPVTDDLFCFSRDDSI